MNYNTNFDALHLSAPQVSLLPQDYRQNLQGTPCYPPSYTENSTSGVNYPSLREPYYQSSFSQQNITPSYYVPQSEVTLAATQGVYAVSSLNNNPVVMIQQGIACQASAARNDESQFNFSDYTSINLANQLRNSKERAQSIETVIKTGFKCYDVALWRNMCIAILLMLLKKEVIKILPSVGILVVAYTVKKYMRSQYQFLMFTLFCFLTLWFFNSSLSYVALLMRSLQWALYYHESLLDILYPCWLLSGFVYLMFDYIRLCCNAYKLWKMMAKREFFLRISKMLEKQQAYSQYDMQIVTGQVYKI